ncbi:class I glutamine amidotransferase-like protein [Jimgerdemannia flammicorona]|uniref:Class I glutamine amidotransferase-like protein n=1 Tax=Jimgerdemannia flammicorona TaxID=994334 RepID=A0A433CLU5_9FUNG|nr:class I glutamine amidotransferase-like protein [Jimgerdemannia flammicorona]
MSSPTTPRVLRLALLVAGTPPPAVVAKYGDYPFLYRRILRKGLQAHHEDAALELSLRDYDVVHRQEYPTDAELMAGEIDGIVITGSAASAYEDKEWVWRLVAFTKRVYEEFPRVKMLGICFGHQIVGMAAGGTVEKNAKGWEFGFTETKLTPMGQKVFGTDKEFINIQEVHQDHVPSLPPNFHLLATTAPHTPVQATLSANGQVLTVQGHPEFPAGFVEELLRIRMAKGIVTEELFSQSLRTLYREGVDDVWIAGKMIEFLSGRWDGKF